VEDKSRSAINLLNRTLFGWTYRDRGNQGASVLNLSVDNHAEEENLNAHGGSPSNLLFSPEEGHKKFLLLDSQPHMDAVSEKNDLGS
jgi:hypothetical protein